ncbi:THAP domain-containing protein 6-like [Anopheles aquasalis]|uniref:THAP domain-containing protein 6-like n=1 Tax=Anopheles aquasalis TaxID=42839 RepID=UPI00215AEA50|nr:THAP domain-containing protein 6-like [Anopheles aquasalis]
MPYRYCVAPFCKNNNNNIKRLGTVIKFHAFPQDVELTRQWVTFCRKDANWRPSKSGAICSEHFRAEDYQLHQSPLIKNYHYLRLLQPSAVPSILQCNNDLPLSTEEIEEERILRINALYKTPKENVLDSASLIQVEQENKEQSNQNQAEEVIKTLKSENQKLTEVILNLQSKLKESRDANENLKDKLKKMEKELKNKDKKKYDSTQIMDVLKEKIKCTLSSNQVDLILKKRKRVKWTPEEISAALTLRYFSKRAYAYLAVDLNYPLPSLSTLQRYTMRNPNVRKGPKETRACSSEENRTPAYEIALIGCTSADEATR